MNSIKYLLFRLGEQYFGVRLSIIKEVILKQDVDFLPNSPQNIKGVFNLRGQIVPVLKLYEIIDSKPPSNDHPQMIVLDGSGQRDFAFQVDEALEVFRLSEDKLNNGMNAKNDLSRFTVSVVSGVTTHTDQMIYVLKDLNGNGDSIEDTFQLDLAS